MEGLEKILQDAILELEPASIPDEPVEYEEIYFDGTETDNSKWLAIMKEQLQTAKTFEIHCWIEEEEWIKLALQYGTVKDTNWKYGTVISGEVTATFTDMLLSLPKPQDKEVCNKMTPFFNVFLDGEAFQSCHYGTEVYRRV